MKFKVLWMEDEVDKMDAFFDLAYNNDIELIHVSTVVDFKRAILKNSRFYFDAIILDALGLMDTTDETPTLRALNEAINFINQHKAIEVIPYIILSGYLGNVEYASVTEMLGSENIYYKSKDEKKLLADIKESMNSKQDAQLKYKYRDLLDVCSDKLLGSDHYSRLFSLIKHVENVEKLNNTEDMLNPVRKVIERIFSLMAEKDIIPKTLLANKGWINGSSLFLANKHSEYEHLFEITPPLISENIHRLLNIIQDASHGEGELKLKVDQYLKSAQSDYLYRSCIYLLFDLLIWFKDFMTKNTEMDSNKSKWKYKVVNENRIMVGTSNEVTEPTAELISGKVININPQNGFAFFKPDASGDNIFIPPHLVTNHSLREGMPVHVEVEEYTDNRTGEVKKRVFKIEI